MSVVRWERAGALRVVDPLTLDELDGDVLVIDGVTAADDPRLGWCRRAPCVVIGCAPAGEPPPASPDIALVGEEAQTVLPPLLANIAAHPHACRVLVDVLRPMPSLDVATGLTVESLAYSALLAGPEFASWLARRPGRAPRDLPGPAVLAQRAGEELRVTLARPENRNAFGAAMRDALFEVLTAAQVDDTVARVVLTAEGPVFSSGGDLTEFGTAPDVVRAHEVRTQRSIGALLAQLGSKVTVHVHGACVGAGVELPAFASRVVAATDASFRLPEIAMGLIPGAGGTVGITHRIGRQRTARLAILGDAIDAGEALHIGLVDEVR